MSANKTYIAGIAVIGLFVTTSFAQAAEINSFSTSFSIAVDENGNGITPDINRTSARFKNSATLNGTDLDLLVDLRFPDASDANFGNANDRQGLGTVGLAGAGLAFNNLARNIRDADAPNERVGPDTRYEDFILNYRFVETGTETAVQLDELSLGFKDLDLNQGSIGREVLTIPNVSRVSVATGGSVDVEQVPSTNAGTNPNGSVVQLIPQSNNNNVKVDLFDVSEFEIRFFNRTGGSNNVSGGFNLVGGSAINVGTEPIVTEVTDVPVPATLGLLGVALFGLGVTARRRG